MIFEARMPTVVPQEVLAVFSTWHPHQSSVTIFVLGAAPGIELALYKC